MGPHSEGAEGTRAQMMSGSGSSGGGVSPSVARWALSNPDHSGRPDPMPEAEIEDHDDYGSQS